MPSIRCVTRKPPKIFIDARNIAIIPGNFDIKELSLAEKIIATNAPTIITEDIALVTDMRGV